MLSVTSEQFEQVRRLYGEPTVATLPGHGPDSEDADEFEILARYIARSKVVLFSPVLPENLDGFFHLRLTQVLAGKGVHPGLAVVLLAAGTAAPSGRFADRVRTGWPFAQSVFVVADGDPQMLSRLLCLPVGRLDNEVAKVPSEARAGQEIALQLQPIWRGCGSTTAFENQVESLVQAGYLTIRLFTDGEARRGTALTTLLRSAIAENSVNAGAHIDALAVPRGLPISQDREDVGVAWATSLASAAQACVMDSAVQKAAGQATAVIANHLETVGLGLALAPAARMLLDTHDDRVMGEREWMRLEGRNETEIRFAEAAAEWFQALVMRLPDICAFVSETELARLGALNPRSTLLLPRSYARPKPSMDPRYDVLLVGDEHVFNIHSIRWFLEEVWRPYLEPASISVAITGRAGLRIQDGIPPSTLLHFLGFVHDLESVRAACRLTAVPDQAGTGISVKMLTTLAVGHPVVTTSQGLRGLSRMVIQQLAALDAAQAFAADIVNLCSDPQRLEERRRTVQRAYQAIANVSDYATLLRSLPPLPPEEGKRRQELWNRIVAPARRQRSKSAPPLMRQA